jgi:hypothetical protein
MGQAHAKCVPLEISHCTGPDPTILRDRPSGPRSADKTFIPFKQAHSHCTVPSDVSPTGAPPAPAMSKSRSMVRKLSRKAGFLRACLEEGKKVDAVDPSLGSGKGPGSLDEDFDTFESLIASGEASKPAGLTTPIHPSKISKASTFKRFSISKGSPFPATAIPAHLRPGSQRHSSITSASSRRKSIKSAHRAEREWRARVAGLAGAKAGPSRSSVVELRGPVPPRRTPGPVMRSPSPEDDTLVTPPQTEKDNGTPAKSIFSNRSFETLGHYAHLMAETDDSPLRDRKSSVAKSISSYFFDADSRSATRPSSMNANQLLSPIPPSPVQHKGSLPPFDSFRASPMTVRGSSMPSSVLLPTMREGDVQWMVPETEPKLKPDLTSQRNDQSRQASHNSSPSHPDRRRNALTLDFIPLRSAPYRAPMRTAQADQTPERLSPKSPKKPNTPYSPMTNYYLTAPIDQILSTSEDSCTPERDRAHPYASAQHDLPFPSPPTPSSKSPLKPIYTVPVQSQPDDLTSFDPFTVPTPTVSRQMYRCTSSNISIPAALGIRKSQPKMEILGTGSTLPRRRVNLTPGMETGNRPPKSGLSSTASPAHVEWNVMLTCVQDLHRWLQSTSISE